jgi:hypothetical protein
LFHAHIEEHKAKLARRVAYLTGSALRAAAASLRRPEPKLTKLAVASPRLSGPAPVPPPELKGLPMETIEEERLEDLAILLTAAREENRVLRDRLALSELPRPASPKISVPPRAAAASGRPGITAHFPFRLLPPGVWDVDHILEYYGNEARHWLDGRSVDNERLVKIGRLKPSRCSVGTAGYLGYILYEFPWSRAVVLECPITGNATYILWGDWQGMLQLTKSEMRRSSTCVRVIQTCRSFGRVIDALDGQKPGISPTAGG